MNLFLKSVSYILHPLWMPLVGAIIYFVTAPRFIPNEIIVMKVFGLVILTVLIPIALYFFLKNIGAVSSIHLENVRQRKIPLLLLCVLLVIVLKVIVDIYQYPELYFFFLGVLFSALSAIFMALFKVKTSLHMIGISGIAMFTIVLSIHFEINLTLLIAFLMAANGLVATSRLHCRAHNNIELALGFFTGLLPQIILANFWL